MRSFLENNFSKFGAIISGILLGIFFWGISFFPLLRFIASLRNGGPLAVVVGVYLSIPALLINIILNSVLFAKMHHGSRVSEIIFYSYIALLIVANIVFF